MKYSQNTLSVVLMLSCLSLLPRLARANDAFNDYRLTVFPYYTFPDKITVFAHLGYELNRDGHTQTLNLLSPGLYYTVNPWLQLWGGLNDRYAENTTTSDTFILGPYVGTKLFLPNKWKMSLYNYTRYEYRASEDFGSHDWATTQRIRSRFEADIPLTSTDRAWQPRTWYALTSVEPFYNFTEGELNPLRVSVGIGYVLNRHVQIEFSYYANFSRSNGGPLQFNENIFRLNFKIGLNRDGDPKKAAADE
jgi:hypothetical protein